MLCVRTGHEKIISKFRAWSKSWFWMCLALGLWAATHLRDRASKFLPQPWSLAAGGITWSTSLQWPKCRFTAAALHLVLQNQSVSGASFPLQFFDPFLYLEGTWNMCFSTDHWRENFLSFVWNVPGSKTGRCALCPKRISPGVPNGLLHFAFPYPQKLNVDHPPVWTKEQIGIDFTGGGQHS